MQRRESLLSAIRPLTFFSNFFYFFMFRVTQGRFVVSRFKSIASFCFIILCSAFKWFKTFKNPRATTETYEQSIVDLTSYLLVVFCVVSHVNFQVHARPITKAWNGLLTLTAFIPKESFYRKAFIVCCLQVGVSNLFFFSYLALYYYFYPEDFRRTLFVLEVCSDYFMVSHFCAVTASFSNGLLLGWKVISAANDELDRLKKIEHYRNTHRWDGLPFVKVAKINQLRGQMNMIKHEDLSKLVEIHDGVCGAAKELNELFGVSLTASSLKNQMEMILSCYSMTKHGLVGVGPVSVWFFYCFVMEVIVIYACEKFVEETKRTGDILNLLVTDNSSQALKDAVQRFSQHLLHRQVEFTACRFFKLNYEFLYSVFSNLITYLAIVAQFDKPQSSPEGADPSGTFVRSRSISGMEFLRKLASDTQGTITPLAFTDEDGKTRRKEESERVNDGFETTDEANEQGPTGEEKTGNSKPQSAEDAAVEEVNGAVRNKNPKNERNCSGRFLACLCRPHILHWVTLALLALATWCVIYSLAGPAFAPGAPFFSLVLLFVLAYISGELITLVNLPPLLGMLLMGCLLRNLGFVHLKGVYTDIAATLREFALCIILIRAGLGLDPNALKNLRVVILRLASIPGIFEGVITTIMSHFLLGLPWLWGMLLGAMLAAVSPAVVIPCLFSLQERGYGTEKGIPTLVVAAASLDDILSITVFGVILNVIYSTGRSLAMQIIEGPLGILMGIAFGAVWGFAAHFVPHKNAGQIVLFRSLMIAGGGLMAVFGSGAIGYQGAGPLGCIIAAFVACLGWRDYRDGHNPVADVYRVIWLLFQPILFGLIGSEIDVSVLELSTIGYGLISLFCSLVGRIVVTVFISFGAGFSWKERIFISWAWFPKATVQAALGPLALDIGRNRGSETEIVYAKKLLVIAVLTILITAPIGAALITTLGPRLLMKTERKHLQEQTRTEDDRNGQRVGDPRGEESR